MDPPEEIFEHIGSNANALQSLYSTILNQRPALHIALPCVRIVDLFRNASLGIRPNEPTRIRQGNLSLSCHGLSESSSVFPAPIGPVVPAQNAKKSQIIACNVPLTRVKRAPLSLTPPPNGLSPPIVANGQPSLSRIRPLVWPAALTKDFVQLFARLHAARPTCN